MEARYFSVTASSISVWRDILPNKIGRYHKLFIKISFGKFDKKDLFSTRLTVFLRVPQEMGKNLFAHLAFATVQYENMCCLLVRDRKIQND